MGLIENLKTHKMERQVREDKALLKMKSISSVLLPTIIKILVIKKIMIKSSLF